jgi:hypothetical protein
MNKIFLFFIIWLHQNLVDAQQTIITGTVLTEEGKPILSANVVLQRKNSYIIHGFAITDSNGHFKISHSISDNDTLLLKASLIGYKSQEKQFFINSQNDTIQFNLSTTIISLPEVKTVTKPIWQRKDTINYDVSSFKQNQDRVIADIIARLPGMEVSANGQIKYQGKAINKFYVEGLDLLEDRYNIANNNIPADVVDKVQVLENHQPIRLLDSLSFSDRAALNIRLKNSSKGTLIGQAKLGLGTEPLLSENELTTMLFKSKKQFINIYKFNNTGVDNSKMLVSQNLTDYFNAIECGLNQSGLLSLVEPGTPFLQRSRYLFNNAHILTFNQLVPLDSTYQLRINSSYINDYQKLNSSVSNRFFLPFDTINFSEQNSVQKSTNLFQADLTLMANSPKYYLKNHFRFHGLFAQSKGLLSNDTNITNQQVNSRFHHFSNDFKIIKARKKNIFEWASFLGYSSQPQQLLIYPGLYEELLNNNNPYNAVLQKADVTCFYTDNSFSVRRRKGRINATTKIGSNWQNKVLKSNLYIETAGLFKNVADTFLNKLDWNRFRIYSDYIMRYEIGSLHLSATLPISFTSITYFNRDGIVTRKSGLVVNPSLSSMLQISPKWVLENTFSYSNKNYGEAEQVAAGYILKTYRNFSNNYSSLPEQSSFNISCNVNFRDPLKTTFLSSGINYVSSNRNIVYEQNFNGSLETLVARVLNNSNRSLAFFSRINKYVITWRTSLSVNASYSFDKAPQLQQNILSNFTNKNLSVGIAISSKINSKLTTDYNATGHKYLTNVGIENSRPPIYSIIQKFSINYFPSEKLVIRVLGDHYYLDVAKIKKQNYFFADFSIWLKSKNKKIDWELIVQNIFNTKQFVSAVNSNNTEIISTYQLRNRQILFKAGFRLN